MNASTEQPLVTSLTRVKHDVSVAALAKIAAFVGGTWLLMRLWEIILWILMSLMLVATLNPMVRRLEKRFTRPAAIGAVATGLVLVLVVPLLLITPMLVTQIGDFIAHAPEYARDVQEALAGYGVRIDLVHQVQRGLAGVGMGGSKMLSVLQVVLEKLTAVGTIVVLSIYLLIEGPKLGTAVLRLLPRDKRLLARRVVADIGAQIGGYMRGQLITSALCGGFCLLLLLALGVPQALALAALAALADVIPVVGVIIGTVPAALMALTLSASKALIVLVAFGLYHQVETHVIGPRVYGTTLGLGLSVIVISLLVGTELLGILGALLALPFAAAIPSVATFIHELGSDEEDAPALPHAP